MESVKDTISKNILFYRKKARLSQKELSAMVGVSNSAISNWENGTNSVDIDTLFKLCKILNIDINTVFGYYNEFNPTSDTYTAKETQLINDYRQLDEPGQNTVDVVLQSQLERCKNIDKI